MCIGVGVPDGGQRRERTLDGHQVGDDLDGLGFRGKGLGPAGDLVEVVADARDLTGALALHRGRRGGDQPSGRAATGEGARALPANSAGARAVWGSKGAEPPLASSNVAHWVSWLSVRKAHQTAPADALEAAPGAPLEAAVGGCQRSPAR